MKKAKKLTALVLAMMMALSIMAVTASAYGAEEHEHVCSEETIQPRKPGATCSYCGYGMEEVRTYEHMGDRYTILQCTNEDCSHCGNTVTIRW